VDLDARAVDEQPGWHAFEPGKIGKDALPHAALGPAPEAVVERLLRAVDVFRTIAPTTAALQRMDNAGEHPPIIYPRHPARILRQERFNPRPLLIRKPEEIHHLPCLLAGDT
jgi:hypothetical protein